MRDIHNTHHILPRSKNGSNRANNLVRLDIRTHNSLHLLFQNKTPVEQIERILDIATTALTDEVKSDIIKILSIKDLDYWYNKWVCKKFLN